MCYGCIKRVLNGFHSTFSYLVVRVVNKNGKVTYNRNPKLYISVKIHCMEKKKVPNVCYGNLHEVCKGKAKVVPVRVDLGNRWR
jgi:hypothetical protein